MSQFTGRKYLADFSLALINRTGAFYISKDVVETLGSYFEKVRYWRWIFPKPPEGLRRKLLGRLMLKEIDALLDSHLFMRADAFKKGARLPTVFFDPLYVLRTRLERDDIVLCHDVGPVSHPQLFFPSTTHAYKIAYEKIKAVKPGVIFVSDASKRAFTDLYGNDYRFLETIPLYFRPSTSRGDKIAPDGVTKPFLLTVGALETRKNYLRVMQAFHKAGLHERGVNYVFCGPRGNQSEEIMAAAAATPGVTALSYASEEELRWLYANASGFVLPSLLEGFGVPALEAAHNGLVPLVSRGGAQEEAVGGHGIFVDPISVDSIADGMIELLALDDERRNSLVARARQHAASLTLQRFLDGWDAVLKNNGPGEILSP